MEVCNMLINFKRPLKTPEEDRCSHLSFCRSLLRVGTTGVMLQQEKVGK